MKRKGNNYPRRSKEYDVMGMLLFFASAGFMLAAREYEKGYKDGRKAKKDRE